PVLHRVHVDLRRQLTAPFGRDAPHVTAERGRDVNRPPSEEATAPGDVGVLAKREEVFVEDFSLDGDVAQERHAVHAGRPGDAEDFDCNALSRDSGRGWPKAVWGFFPSAPHP